MALTELQRDILRLLAPSRLARESFVAGGVALSTQLETARRSRDVDLFHDTIEALAATVVADRDLLSAAGFEIQFTREAPTFAEAMVHRDRESTLIQWVHDSAYRFFPLQIDAVLGLTLHPLDLATNKVLAMAGRLEARDFVDLVACNDRLQPLGYLVWAACGKDPGYGPGALLQDIQRAGSYTQAELDLLEFEGPTPNAASLAKSWHEMLRTAHYICDLLPIDEIGTCVVGRDGELCRLAPEQLEEALAAGTLLFHRGTIGGAWPSFPRRQPRPR